jgi:hypothetical protein
MSEKCPEAALLPLGYRHTTSNVPTCSAVRHSGRASNNFQAGHRSLRDTDLYRSDGRSHTDHGIGHLRIPEQLALPKKTRPVRLERQEIRHKWDLLWPTIIQLLQKS